MKYNGNNLEEVLALHNRWLNKSEGWSDEDRADLSGANLSRTNLLVRERLIGANLSGAYMAGADLTGVDLTGAFLIGANLGKAYLIRANLRKANLRGINLRGADMIEANLTGADITGADLTGADLRGAKNVPFIPLACPDTGAFVAWKKCESTNGTVIVKLLIPEDARRSSGTGRKCRADMAVVLEIQTIDGDVLEGDIVWSMYDSYFIYEVGKTVTPNKPFCEDRFDECSSGIHFFINRQEAVEY